MRRVFPVVVVLLALLPALSNARDRGPGARPARAGADSLGRTALVLRGEGLGDRFGDPVATAGDVNGDGFDDLVVGAWAYGAGGLRNGRAYVFMGSPAGVDTVPAWVRTSPNPGAHFGVSVASAGDVDGDGYADVLVGAGRDSVEKEGRAFLYRGSPAGLDTVPAWTGRGVVTHSWYGTSVAGAGDLNGDGYADVVVGAPNYPGPGGRTGAAFVHYGSPAGLGAAPTAIVGDLPGSWFGYSVASAGDVNGDGFGDLVVGAVYATVSHTWEGRAYLYLGSAAGIATAPAWTARGDNPGASFGFAVGGAGDVNADGFDDVLVGAHHFDTTLVQTYEGQGRAFLFLGSPGGLSASAPWWITGRNLQAHLGRAVGRAGDVNDDGIDDMYVSTLRYTGTRFSEGRLEVFLGRAGVGPATISDWSYAPGVERLALGQAMGADMDLNGDGAIDVVAGSSGPSEDVNPVYGEVHVIYGIPGTLAVPPPVAPGAVPALGPPAPQPFRDRVRVPFSLPAAGHARVAVFDVGGRAIVSLLDGVRPAGPGSVTWDGRDAGGARCAPGVYVVRLDAPGGGARRLVSLVR